ncbi:MFS transporter [Paractinoplanes durhamensis]|uniref:MFS transporter n=1 Tax=Paractinoplanes durhamensis TaxID=113563 RepID=A0ABQ3YPX5_9ACTN|nr:MFS transporter [Actinoplanes durhamensis]
MPRQFWFLWVGTLINRLGSFVVIFLAIYLTSERHFSQSQAGLVIGLYGVGGAIGTTVGGVLADRWGRRPTMLTAQFGAAALMLTLGFAYAYWQILAVTFLLGVVTEAVRPAFMAMMIDVVPDRDRVRAYSLNYWAINLGFALSAVGAGLAAKANYLLLFVVDAGSTLITAVIGLIFLAETRPARPAGARVRAADGGMRTALRDRTFVLYLVISLGSVIVMMQHLSTLPIAMAADGLSAATYGWVIAVNGVLIVLGQLFVPRLIEGYDRSRVLALAALIIGVGFGLGAVANVAWFFALTVVIWTLGEMLQSPSNAATVAALSPVALRGRYQGLSSLSWSAGTALAPIAGGFTQEHLGDTALWLGCFGLCALVALGHLITGPRRERRITQLLAASAPADAPEIPFALPPVVAEPVADTPNTESRV